MDYSMPVRLEHNFRLDNVILDPLRDPQPHETSRFLNILDSPTNSNDGENNRIKDFSSVETSKPEIEEPNNLGYFPTKVVLAKNLPLKTTEMELYSACETFGAVK
jgi:hypothetical protein